MKTATISETKNSLSSVLDRVKAGETVLITDRGVPVARLEPVATSAQPTGRRDRLVRAGLMRAGIGRVPAEILEEPTVRTPDGVSSAQAVLDERRSGW
jgi:prevent-host-death family protein